MGLVADAGHPFPSPRLRNPIASRRIFSDVAQDITISVDGQSFLLHKFPLVSRCGRIRRMIADAGRDADVTRLELAGVPGGAPAFELAAKFCYGANFEVDTGNAAQLLCVAEYLDMTDDYGEENLAPRMETYLSEVVLKSLGKSLEVLCACERLDHPVVEETGLADRCAGAIAAIAGKEQLVSGLARLDCDARSEKLRLHCQDWWLEELPALGPGYFRRVVVAMRRAGVRPESILNSIMYYAQVTLKSVDLERQRVATETLVGLLATEKIAGVPMPFLFGMLRMAIEVDAGMDYRIELERRISLQLEMASLDDLLIPSVADDALFDVDTVHRILVNFLQRIEEADDGFGGSSGECSDAAGYESGDGDGDEKSPSHGAILKVGRLMDGYLAEIAPDPNLSLPKFMAMIELLPDYARIVDDGLYRAVDIYLKAHPGLTETECRKLCKLIDCQKLSQEAANHAAQNDRLPVQMAVRVLYFEQLRLRSGLSGDPGTTDNFLSQRMVSSGAPSAPVSPRDNYASLRRENRELKLEIARMRVRLSELEREQGLMKQGAWEGRSGGHGRAFLASVSRGIGRIAMLGSSERKKQRQVSPRRDASKSRRRHRRMT